MAIGRTNAGGGSTFLPNLLDNSDFLHFVAQAGVGGNHGTQTYAGDRWILDSGTVTGAENANGNGYSTITLDGTIRQIVAEPPSGQYACAVEMVSGTATIAYADGEVTITSSGGVLKNAGLYAGSRAPKYVPKGYGAELMECYRYYFYVEYSAAGLAGYAHSGTEARVSYFLPTKMRISPTVAVGDISQLTIFPAVKHPTSATPLRQENNVLVLCISISGINANAVVALKANTSLEFSADM